MDGRGFVRQVNQELQQLWEQATGYDPTLGQKVAAIDGKIANIRRAIEDGLSDAVWANARLGELLAEREKLAAKPAVSDKPPQIDLNAALAYRRDLDKLLAHAEPAEQKRLLRLWLDEMKLAPERLEVDITYRIPEPVMDGMVAGAVFVPDWDKERLLLVAARWIYAPAKQGAREMQRIGLAA